MYVCMLAQIYVEKIKKMSVYIFFFGFYGSANILAVIEGSHIHTYYSRA